MEVILCQDISSLGKTGDVVKVKDGYARNFLIPQGKAKRATAENRKVFEERRAELEKVQAEKLAAAPALAPALWAVARKLSGGTDSWERAPGHCRYARRTFRR